MDSLELPPVKFADGCISPPPGGRGAAGGGGGGGGAMVEDGGGSGGGGGGGPCTAFDCGEASVVDSEESNNALIFSHF